LSVKEGHSIRWILSCPQGGGKEFLPGVRDVQGKSFRKGGQRGERKDQEGSPGSGQRGGASGTAIKRLEEKMWTTGETIGGKKEEMKEPQNHGIQRGLIPEIERTSHGRSPNRKQQLKKKGSHCGGEIQ